MAKSIPSQNEKSFRIEKKFLRKEPDQSFKALNEKVYHTANVKL